MSLESAILLIHCPDRPGLVAHVTEFLYKHQGNIIHLDQHVDSVAKVFFMRVEWDLANFTLAKDEIFSAFQPIAEQFGMTWQLHFSDEVMKMVLFVTEQSHALYDILSRWQAKEFLVDIPIIVSNHDTLQPIAEQFGIPFRVFPVTKATKAEVENEQIVLLKEIAPDFIVLARYMQILTDNFVRNFPNQIINIHHSFLPAFIGARPYHQAFDRGVKIIGATSHFVTAELDAGAIIEQDVTRVSHRDSPADMIRKGKDLEKTVLSRAIYLHLKHRILVYNNKTVVFS
jgi:formyltetrahydrofolate deformylase